ncbi:uncharacterized protein LOC113312320 [Papaver somniferum]|nr:uncharacterized protein LOC113312320 [Papaver somniferum]
MASFRIPPKELLRFSHRVPSYKMIGKEGEDIPKVSFELDPASVSGTIERTSNPGNLEARVEANVAKVTVSSKAPAEEILHKQKKRNKPEERNTMDSGGNSKCSNRSQRLANVNKKTRTVETSTCLLDKNKKTTVVSDKQKSCDDSTFVRERVFTCHAAADSKEMGPDGMSTIPSSLAHLEANTGFYDFDSERSHEKFKTGQIWALYCDLDVLPKYYGKIKNVELFPVFKLHIQWLESCSSPKGVIPLVDRSMPVCCGTFKVTRENEVYDDLGCFSHQLSCVPAGRNLYNIYPRKGEVWALYNNFSSEWRYSDLKYCGYYIVEVIEVIDACWIQVLVLQNVTGLKTVFQAKKEVGGFFFMRIPWTELCRFSHQVPSFKLAEAKHGNLYGCWALDPKSMPVYVYSN